MKWRILFICFLPIWHIPVITAKSQEVLTGYRPLQSGDKISTVEMYVLCRKLFEKVNNPGHGKGIVSGAKSPQDLCDTLFERLFFTTKRISTISDIFIPALDALQEIAITEKDADRNKIKHDRDSSDEEYKKTTHYTTWSAGTAQYIYETEAAKDHHRDFWAYDDYPDINTLKGTPDVHDDDDEPKKCKYTLLTKHDDDHQYDLDKSVLKKNQKENDHIKKDKKRVLTRLKFKPVSARKSNLSRNKTLQRNKMEPVDEQVEKVLKVVALLHNTNQNADDETDRVETLTEYFQKLITIDDLNESTTPKMQPVVHNLGDDDVKDSEGENTEREKTAFKTPAELLLSDENV